ncbi:MAG: Ig-like domain-containing protein, partial [Bacteroidales bacterium]|nr:Ig-like domain-containing protein [Bacteroidales bacterium]
MKILLVTAAACLGYVACLQAQTTIITDVNFPTANAITYSPSLKLADVLLNHDGNTGGTFAWTNPTTVPLASTSEYDVTFTPVDTYNFDYSSVQGWNVASRTVIRAVHLTVNKAVPPEIAQPTMHPVTYSPTLRLGQILINDTPAGFFMWSVPSTVPVVNNSGYPALFFPFDKINYDYGGMNGWNGVSVPVSIRPDIRPAPVTEDIVFQHYFSTDYNPLQTLGNLLLFSNPKGVFEWEQPTAVPQVAIRLYPLCFTPFDGINYDYSGLEGWNGASLVRMVTVEVFPLLVSDTEVVFPHVAPVTYHPQQTLANIPLNGGQGAGSFVWSTPDAVPPVSSSGFQVIFTPADASNYDYSYVSGWNGTTIVRQVALTVWRKNMTDADIVFPETNPVTFTPSQTLGNIPLIGGSILFGVFTWMNPSTPVLEGIHSYPVAFTPSDVVNCDYSSMNGWNGSNLARDVSLIATSGKINSNLTLSVPENISQGSEIICTATVSSSVGNGIPNATVWFSVNQGNATSVQADASGVAEWRTSSLSVGLHIVKARYDGDAAYEPSEASRQVLVTDVPSSPTEIKIVVNQQELTVSNNRFDYQASCGESLFQYMVQIPAGYSVRMEIDGTVSYSHSGSIEL